MKTSLGSLLASTMQAIGAGFRAFFTFTERDARILASTYGFPPPKMQDWQDSGISTLHLAAALRDNGDGRLITTEFEPSKV